MITFVYILALTVYLLLWCSELTFLRSYIAIVVLRALLGTLARANSGTPHRLTHSQYTRLIFLCNFQCTIIFNAYTLKTK